MKEQYNTKQRNQLLNFFKEHNTTCFTAKDIISRKEILVGEATVYRILTKLSNEGLIKKFISVTSSGAMYQYNETDNCDCHFHLKCLKCGELVHMDCSFMFNMEQHIKEEHNFSVDNSKTILYGVCKDCK